MKLGDGAENCCHFLPAVAVRLVEQRCQETNAQQLQVLPRWGPSHNDKEEKQNLSLQERRATAQHVQQQPPSFHAQRWIPECKGLTRRIEERAHWTCKVITKCM
jgi:hypothetical protein